MQQHEKRRSSMQKALFPMQYLRITQDELSTYSHAGSLAMDFGGKDGASDDRIYAPADMRIVRVRTDSSHETYAETTAPVLWADGTQDYMNFTFMHDNYLNSKVKVGAVLKQGAYFFDEGGFGGSRVDRFARHLHMEVGRGKSPAKQVMNSKGTYMTPGQVNIYKALWVAADCTVLSGLGHPWKRTTDKLLDPTDNGNDPVKGDTDKMYCFDVATKDAGKLELFRTADVNATFSPVRKLGAGKSILLKEVALKNMPAGHANKGAYIELEGSHERVYVATGLGYGEIVQNDTQYILDRFYPDGGGDGVPQAEYDAMVKDRDAQKAAKEAEQKKNTTALAYVQQGEAAMQQAEKTLKG
jgi:hypothetical protein